MPKVLKPYTIIPSNLYVHRDADRQVKNLINDMGRPGYVLVSRQMGKTNLLLNAKRELEAPDDVFVYVDLSNSFENAKDNFENIIDTAIETNEEKFETAKKQILEQRAAFKDTPPHKQHTNELRVLLKAIKGKLVIILDEIDGLTNTSYSDQIFAQIRSIYFSRINYEELSRLTYLLSGVIEPTDIIKDPKISPFNIGQKIFLNDFSKEEFNLFLSKAELSIDEVTADRIFYWTNGNPRMTWDLCSEVENIIKKESASPSLIDKLVSQIYLTTFDKPPIDNIRELVKQDKDIRNALIDIKVTKGAGVSDKLKSKLYLAGIINYEENNIQIKNNIIGNCLNQNWLSSLEIEDKGLLQSALNLIDIGNFQEGVKIFEKYLNANELEQEQKNLSYFQLAYASIQLQNFEKALHYSELIDFDKDEEARWYYKSKLQKGLIYFYLKNVESSLNNLRQVIEAGQKDEDYLRAILNYGSILISSDLVAHKEEATRIFQEVANEFDFDKKKLKESLIHSFRTIAYFNLSQIFLHDNDLIKAKENLNFALENSDEDSKPAIILKLVDVEEQIKEKKRLLNQVTKLIISGEIKPVEPSFEKPLDFTFNQLREAFILAYEVDKEDIFNQLTDKLNLLGDKTYLTHLYDLAIWAMSIRKPETSIKILKDIYSKYIEEKYVFENTYFYYTLKILSYFNEDKKNLSYSIEYIDLFKNARETIDYLDFDIIANIIWQLSERNQYNQALKYIELITSLKPEVNSELLINYVLILHLELNIYRATGNQKLTTKARELIEFANSEEFKHQKTSLLGDAGLEIIKRHAQEDLSSKILPLNLIGQPSYGNFNITNSRKEPITANKTYGRNAIVKVRYKNGSILEAKFKKVELDIKKGDCVIIE